MSRLLVARAFAQRTVHRAHGGSALDPLPPLAPRPDRAFAELLLAHSTDMPELLWHHPEWRRALAGWNATMEKRPVESTVLGGVAVLCLGAALLHLLYPSSAPMLEGDATMFLGDGDGMELPPLGAPPSVSVLVGDDGATVASAADAAAAAAAGMSDFASPARAEHDGSLWGLLESLGAPPRERLALSLRNRLGFVTLPAFSSSSMPADPWTTGQGPCDTTPGFSLAGSDAESREWLARHAQIAPAGFVERAQAYSESVGAAMRVAVGTAAVAGSAAWAGIRAVRWLGGAATPRLRTRALSELERAADLAMDGLHRLAKGAFGEASAAAIRHRAWAAQGRGAKAARGPASLAGADSAGVDLPALSRPMSTSGAGGVASAAAAVAAMGAGSVRIGRRTLRSWEVESASLTVDLSDVLRALGASSDGAASLSRLMRAMRPLRRRLADRGSRSRLTALEGGAGDETAAGKRAREDREADEWDACSEAGEEVDVDLSEEEVEATACFLLSLVRDGASGGAHDRAASFASELSAEAAHASDGATSPAGEARSGQRRADGALVRRSDPSGTGSTADGRRGAGSAGRPGDAEPVVPLAGLRVTSPRDRSFVRVLEAMQRLELERKHASDESRAPECVLCLDPMLPHQPLVRSSHGACSRYHIFHRDCFPLRWAQDHGCPVCREPVFALRPAAVDTPFVLHAPGPRGGVARP